MTEYKLPDLPYDYGALEPVISGKIMELHHSKHHQGYVTNLNAALQKYAEAEGKGDVAGMIAAQHAVKFNGGGHVNHTLFWENLAPEGDGGEPSGELADRLSKKYGSTEGFIEKFNTKVAPLQGSGWGWLGYGKENDCICIFTCPNPDPLSLQGYVPLLGIDVWEHAYYLQYENRRPEYLKNIWKVINWNVVEKRFNAARK